MQGRYYSNSYLKTERNRTLDLLLGEEMSLGEEERKILQHFAVADDLGHFLHRLSPLKRFQAKRRLRRLVEAGFLLPEATRFHHERLPLSTVDLELTAECQAKCPICPRDVMPRVKEHMREEIFLRVVEQIKPYGSSVILSGLGDCLLHPAFLKHLQYLRKSGIPAHIVTNGNLLTPEMRQKILEIGAHHVTISFQAFSAEIYAQTMGLDFQETFERVKAFVKEARGKLPVTICFVQNQQNEHETQAFRNFWRSLGVATFITGVNNRGGWVSDPAVHPEFDQATGQKLKRCGLFNTRIFVTCDGDILACCNDIAAQEKLGHILRDSLADILKAKTQRILEQKFFGMCATCDDASRHKTISVNDLSRWGF